MKTVTIYGKEYACIPVDAVEQFKETVIQSLKYPEATSPRPLDALLFTAKELLKEDWPLFMLELKAEVEASTCDTPNPHLEAHERPYTRDEHMAVLSRYLSAELLEDFINGDL